MTNEPESSRKYRRGSGKYTPTSEGRSKMDMYFRNKGNVKGYEGSKQPATLTSINATLAKLNEPALKGVRVRKAKGYYEFFGGASATWKSKRVLLDEASNWTLGDWVVEAKRLSKGTK